MKITEKELLEEKNEALNWIINYNYIMRACFDIGSGSTKLSIVKF